MDREAGSPPAASLRNGLTEVPLIRGPRSAGALLRAIAVPAGLAFFLVAGAALRLADVDDGNPYVYHPDEWYIVKNAMNMVRDLDPLPHFYTYPSLMILLAAALVSAVHGLGGPTLATNQAWLHDREVIPEQFVYFLAVRCLVVILGLATIIVGYKIGSRLRGRTAGLAAAAILAFAPLHIEHSRWATTDVPVGLAAALALLVTIRAASDGRDRWWIAAGVAAGLAGSTKWTGLLVLGVPLLACLLATGRPLDVVAFARRRTPWLIGAAAVATVVAVTPGLLLEPRIAARGLLVMTRHYGSAEPSSDVDSIPFAVGALADGIGPLVLLLALVGLGVILAARRASELPIVAFVGVFVGIVALAPRQYERNLLPVLPYLAVAAGVALAVAAGRLQGLATGWLQGIADRRPGTGHRASTGQRASTGKRASTGRLTAGLPGLAMAGLLAVALAPGIITSVAAATSPDVPDTRTIALQWVELSIRPGSAIAREAYTPQVGPAYRVHPSFYLSDLTMDDYRRLGIQYFIASDSAYARFLAPGAAPAAAAFYAELFGLPEIGRIEPGPGRHGPLIRIFELAAR